MDLSNRRTLSLWRRRPHSTPQRLVHPMHRSVRVSTVLSDPHTKPLSDTAIAPPFSGGKQSSVFSLHLFLETPSAIIASFHSPLPLSRLTAKRNDACAIWPSLPNAEVGDPLLPLKTALQKWRKAELQRGWVAGRTEAVASFVLSGGSVSWAVSRCDHSIEKLWALG